MARKRTSKDKVYTIADRLADAIRSYKPSKAVQKSLEGLAKTALVSLAKAFLAKKLDRKKVDSTVKTFSKKVFNVIKVEVKKKF